MLPFNQAEFDKAQRNTELGLPAAVTLAPIWRRILAQVLSSRSWRLTRVAALRKPAGWMAALSGLQLATGLSNVVLDWPLLAAVLHTGGAGALVLVLTWTVAASRTGNRVKAAVPKLTTWRQTA